MFSSTSWTLFLWSRYSVFYCRIYTSSPRCYCAELTSCFLVHQWGTSCSTDLLDGRTHELALVNTGHWSCLLRPLTVNKGFKKIFFYNFSLIITVCVACRRIFQTAPLDILNKFYLFLFCLFFLVNQCACMLSTDDLASSCSVNCLMLLWKPAYQSVDCQTSCIADKCG